ncbi:MAG: efflux transporter outer membrane subunit [Rikenellaceae bacterium]
MKKIIYTVLLALFTNCSPLLERPEVVMPEWYRYGEDFSSDSLSIDLRWWERFGDTTINRVVEQALYYNRDLRASLAKVDASREYIAVAKAEFLPSIYLSAEAELYKINGVETKELSTTPTLEWELSLFGKLRYTKADAVAEYLSQEWGYRAAVLSLSSEVVTALFTLAQYQESYQIAERSYELRVKATALVDSLHRYGMSNGIALEQARSMVYSARSEMAKYRRAMEQASLALNLLMGTSLSQTVELHTFTMPPDIPIGLPSELLERRPDVMESLYAMESAAMKVGIARAERFPSITLTADGGLVTETLTDLSSAKPFGWSLLGSVTQPIFNFGKLKRNERMAYQNYVASMNSYEQATLSALNDVERALVAIATYRDELLASRSTMVANAKISLTTTALYRSGMGDYLSVVDAERDLYSSQIEYAELRTQQYINYITLIKALGGGY